MPSLLPGTRWALTPPFHPSLPRGAGGLLSVALSLGSPRAGVTRRLFTVEPGLSSTRAKPPPRPPGRLTRRQMGRKRVGVKFSLPFMGRVAVAKRQTGGEQPHGSPSPLWGGTARRSRARGGVRRPQARSRSAPSPTRGDLEVIPHGLVAEPQSPIPLAAKHAIPHTVMLHTVLVRPPVDLDHQPASVADKVEKIAAKGGLTSKMPPLGAHSPKAFPEPQLRRRPSPLRGRERAIVS